MASLDMPMTDHLATDRVMPARAMTDGRMARHPPAVDTGWRDEHRLGDAAMDRLHEDFFVLSQRLLEAGEADARTALAAFTVHAQEHFGQEDAWMRAGDFPARACHADEHAAVLRSLAEVDEALASGRAGVALVHALARELRAWFPGHATHMDSALAIWRCQRRHGAQPVVLRRPGTTAAHATTTDQDTTPAAVAGASEPGATAPSKGPSA